MAVHHTMHRHFFITDWLILINYQKTYATFTATNRLLIRVKIIT